MYGFLRRPKWIALTLAVAALMVAMVNLGLWQLRRLDERRAANTDVRARTSQPAVPVESILGQTAAFADVPAVQWRTITATGTYDVDREVLVANRSFDGAPGLHVLTPLKLADGRALLVNRGWVPIATTAGTTVVPPAPPTGTVTVTARLRETQVRGRLGPSDPATGRLTTLARADVARIAQQVLYPLVPAYAEVVPPTDAAAAVSLLPRPLPLPELGDGPHLSYAVQWFVFTLCAAGGWMAVVRRQVRENTRRAAPAAGAAYAAGTVQAAGGAEPAGSAEQPA